MNEIVIYIALSKKLFKDIFINLIVSRNYNSILRPTTACLANGKVYEPPRSGS